MADVAMDRETYRRKTDPKWNAVGLIEEIEERVDRGFYSFQSIAISPLEYLDWTTTKIELVKHQHGGILPFPEHMLETTTGVPVPMETL